MLRDSPFDWAQGERRPFVRLMSTDIVTANILRAKLAAIVDDMSTALANTARCSHIRTSRQSACGILDAKGRVIALDNPLHLPAVAHSSAACLDYYQFATSAGDAIITNDPYSGGTTIHYFTIVAPFGYGDDLAAYLVVRAHMVDIGGVVMGNYHPGAKELWAEGVRIAPLKIVVDGKTRRHAMDTVALNGRDPETFRGDTEAALATANIGRQRLRDLFAAYGPKTVCEAMRSSIEYSEKRFLAALGKIPEGNYTGEAWLDHDGQGRKDLAIRVELERGNGGIRLDFTGADEQSEAFVNSAFANTCAYAMLPLLGLLEETVLWNVGLLGAVQVVTGEKTLVNPGFPAPTGWSEDHVGFEIAEAVRQALAKALPEQAGPASTSRSLVFTVTKDTRVGDVEEQLRVTDLAALSPGGCPAWCYGDGWGQPGAASRAELPSIEEFESEGHVRIERFEYRGDSGGAGRWRGGLGTETVIRFYGNTREHLFACIAGARHRPPGCAQGNAGAGAAITVSHQNTSQPITSVLLDAPLDEETELTILAPGGGGWGLPIERPPERVLADVVAGYVSIETAQADYGVVIDASTLKVDSAATQSLRTSRGARNALEEG